RHGDRESAAQAETRGGKRAGDRQVEAQRRGRGEGYDRGNAAEAAERNPAVGDIQANVRSGRQRGLAMFDAEAAAGGPDVGAEPDVDVGQGDGAGNLCLVELQVEIRRVGNEVREADVRQVEADREIQVGPDGQNHGHGAAYCQAEAAETAAEGERC